MSAGFFVFWGAAGEFARGEYEKENAGGAKSEAMKAAAEKKSIARMNAKK